MDVTVFRSKFSRGRMGGGIPTHGLAGRRVGSVCLQLNPSTLAMLDGRVDDGLYTADGRRIGSREPVFKGQVPLREAQIVQEALTGSGVRYVPAPGFSTKDESAIVQQLQERLGLVEVIMEPVDEVPREPNGKFRAVICDLSKEQKELFK